MTLSKVDAKYKIWKKKLNLYVAKEQSQGSEFKKEKVTLDGCLQLTIIEFMDLNMFGDIAPYESAKRMWEMTYIPLYAYELHLVCPNWKILW